MQWLWYSEHFVDNTQAPGRCPDGAFSLKRSSSGGRIHLLLGPSLQSRRFSTWQTGPCCRLHPRGRKRTSGGQEKLIQKSTQLESSNLRPVSQRPTCSKNLFSPPHGPAHHTHPHALLLQEKFLFPFSLKRGRETLMCDYLSHIPQWGPRPQPRHVP